MRNGITGKIVCPNCGVEYLPGEIYIPKYLVGQPKKVWRDALTHKIINSEGIDPITEEHYKCDFCTTSFKVQAQISFKTEAEKKFDDFSVTLNKANLFLKED